MSFAPSIYQQAVFDFVANGQGSALIDAVAGSGKTTTITKALALIPATQKVLFLAFNKKIATELQSRVPSHVRAATFHSQAFAAWRRMYPDCQIEDSKTRKLLRLHFSDIEVSTFGTPACKLVAAAKTVGVRALVPDEPSTYFDLADHFDIQLSESEEVRQRTIAAAQKLLALSIDAAKAPRGLIDFDDMLFMCLLEDIPFFKQDWVFVDESQDTNQVQLALLRRMLKPTGRLVAVGDPRQAIYGFRGADAEAMNNIRLAFNCQTLPLSISYRCAKSVVRLAQSLVPHIQASDTAPEGEVLQDVSMASIQFSAEDVVICRNTAPLIELAYELIGKGRGCRVLGREIGLALASLVEKMKAKDLADLQDKLDAYVARETSRFIAKHQEQQAEAVRDKVDCILAIIRNLDETMRDVASVLASINVMFSDSRDAKLLTLCTAHKSKGLEWDRVFIYRSDLMPSKWARQDWQKLQEANLQYVAWTRAKKTLVFLSDSKPIVAKEETMRQRALRIDAEKGTIPHDFWQE